MKIAVIGAGAVGSTLAMRVIEEDLADVVMVDIARDMAIGKAIDLLDASPVVGHERSVTGTDDYALIAGADIVVITAGFARKPGMTREELIAKNASIVKGASEKIKQYCPRSIVIVVTNPLDTMTYLAYKSTGFPKEKVFGMAGVLDGARFIALLADQLKVKRSSIETYMLGSHGDTMVPLVSQTRVQGKKLEGLLPKETIEKIIKRTRDRGAEVVSLLGSGSAYYSPSAAVVEMIKAIMKDTKKTLVASVYAQGEYGLRDLCIGLPCSIGKSGIIKVVEMAISDDEMRALHASAQAIKATLSAL